MGLYNSFSNVLLDILAIRTIYVVNTLDQPVTINIYGSISEENAGVQLDSMLLDPGAEDFRTLLATVTGAVPYVYVTAQCSASPSEGEVAVYWLKRSFQEEMLKEEIRDTNVHKSMCKRWWIR